MFISDPPLDSPLDRNKDLFTAEQCADHHRPYDNQSRVFGSIGLGSGQQPVELSLCRRNGLRGDSLPRSLAPGKRKEWQVEVFIASAQLQAETGDAFYSKLRAVHRRSRLR